MKRFVSILLIFTMLLPLVDRFEVFELQSREGGQYVIETENEDAILASIPTIHIPILLKANTYNDQKTLELYRYVDGKFGAIEARLAEQAVRNQGVADAIREVSKDIDTKVALEAERRACADGKIVSYVNATFAPKLIADYTAGTTTTPAPTYNPLCCNPMM